MVTNSSISGRGSSWGAGVRRACTPSFRSGMRLCIKRTRTAVLTTGSPASADIGLLHILEQTEDGGRTGAFTSGGHKKAPAVRGNRRGEPSWLEVIDATRIN